LRSRTHTHIALDIRCTCHSKKHGRRSKNIHSKCMSCAKPDPEMPPTLHELVSKFQTHHCNKYCTNVYKQNNTFYKNCRLGSLRPSNNGLQLNDVIDCLAVNTKKRQRTHLYHLARKTDESHINDYNAALSGESRNVEVPEPMASMRSASL